MAIWQVFWASLWNGLWEAYLETHQTIFLALTALGTLAAARFAWIATKETQRAAQGQLMKSILDSYADPEMLEALKRLKVWTDMHGENFAEDFARARVEARTASRDFQEDLDRPPPAALLCDCPATKTI